jgi:UPF0176 protein
VGTESQSFEEKGGKKPKVAMFCTGGIRCEKSTSLMLEHGFEDVYHLQGGILKYLEKVPAEESLWQGECFVFDERVSVGHGLKPGPHELCRCCREPLPEGAQASPLFELGVSCPRCHALTTEAQKTVRANVSANGKLPKPNKSITLEPPTSRNSANLLPMNAPVLYSFRRCPYAMRARLALWVSGRRCEIREIALSQKPESMLAASPKGTVPVLLVNGQVLEESLDIMRWALNQNDPAQWQTEGLPCHEDALNLVKMCDQEFKFNLDRYKYPNRYHLADGLGNREQGVVYLKQLEERLSRAANLMGDAWTWVDAAIAPFVRQFARTDRHWFDQQAWPALEEFAEKLATITEFQAVMYKYKVWHQRCQARSFSSHFLYKLKRSFHLRHGQHMAPIRPK